MVDVKEIKSIKLTPFTKMSALIYGILGFIAALGLLIILTIVQVAGVLPQLGQFNVVTGVGIPLIILLPIVCVFQYNSSELFLCNALQHISSKIRWCKIRIRR